METRVMILPRLRPLTGVTALAALLSSAALFTGCGAASKAVGLANACPTSEPGVTPNTVEIGLVYPDTGTADLVKTFSGSRSAVEARIALQNANGGVDGRRIDLVWRDDQSDSRGFSLAAHDLVDTQNIFGLIALTTVLDASAEWLQAQDVPVTGMASSAAWSSYPNLFHFGNLFNKGAVSTFGDYVQHQGGTKAMIIIDPSAGAYQSLVSTYTASLQSRGVQVVGTVPYTAGVTSLASIADQVTRSGADTLIGSALTDGFIDIYSAARRQGAKFNVALNLVGYSADLLARRGPDMAGMSLLTSYAPPDAPGMIAYDRAMNVYSPELADPSNEVVVAAYVAADEMVRGLQLAGPCPTRASFIHNLRQEKEFTGSGLLAPVDLSDPHSPLLCQNFIKVDPTGHSFTTAPPPPALDHDGSWCGQAIPSP
jgi:ABC-type branched-subunit amino acid transport system substrate-binding protein